MPDNVCDVSVLKKSMEENRAIINQADIKIKNSADAYMNGDPTREGLSLCNHIAGLFGQRLWFYCKTKNYSNKLKIDTNKCISCGNCISIWPTNNLIMNDNRISSKDKCTMCYKCISQCPQKAITLIGKEVVQQYRYDKC